MNNKKYNIINMNLSNKINLINDTKELLFISAYECINNSLILMNDNIYYLFYLNIKP